MSKYLMRRMFYPLLSFFNCYYSRAQGREIEGRTTGRQGEAPQAAYSPYPPKVLPSSSPFLTL